jgi:hypothetical protein
MRHVTAALVVARTVKPFEQRAPLSDRLEEPSGARRRVRIGRRRTRSELWKPTHAAS